MSKSLKSKKLLFINHTDNLRGGGENNLLGLIKAANKRGYITHVVVPVEGEFSEAVKKTGASCTTAKFFWWGRSASNTERNSNLLAIKTMVDLINVEKIDCVITNTLVVPWGALAAALADLPHVWIASERLVANQYLDFQTHYDFIGSFSNLIIADSKNNAAHIRSQTKAINVKHFYAFVDVENIQLSRKHTPPKIVNIASIQPRKNQLQLLEAVAKIKKQKKYDLKILFMGNYRKEDEYYQKLVAFINKEKLNNNVTFTGYIQNPFENVGPNDIIVLPSVAESLSHTITEAMKLGLICIASDLPATKESFRLGGGTTYKNGSLEDLASTILEILENPQIFRKRAKIAQKRALENLSEEKGHQLFFTELEKIFGHPNPRRELRHLSYQLRAK